MVKIHSVRDFEINQRLAHIWGVLIQEKIVQPQ